MDEFFTKRPVKKTRQTRNNFMPVAAVIDSAVHVVRSTASSPLFALQSCLSGYDQLLAVLQLLQNDDFMLKVHIANADVDKRVGANASGEEGVHRRPIPPLSPLVALRLLQKALKLRVSVRFLDGFVFLQQLQADVAHVLAFLAEAEEDPQPSQPRVDGCDPVALLHLMVDEVLHDLSRDLADALHWHASLEVAQILRVVFQRSRGKVLQTTVAKELFNDVFQCLLTNCVYLFNLLPGH